MTPIPLSRTPRNTRILVTLFLLTMLAAFGVAGLNIYDKVARYPKGVVARYGPDTESAVDLNSLPAENEAMIARMNSFSQLVDVTHAHAFELPLVMFVLAHFLMRSRVPEWFKLANYVGSSVGTVLFLGAPWLVRYVSAGMAGLFYVGAAGLITSAVLMIAVPIWDMWREI